ncbi:MAG: hypothetical protein JNJ85_07940 [Candidatus Kapabacteria bacterium]|nr:hypothetical protein [Candidatus Kapabacteria bacterium]
MKTLLRFCFVLIILQVTHSVCVHAGSTDSVKTFDNIVTAKANVFGYIHRSNILTYTGDTLIQVFSGVTNRDVINNNVLKIRVWYIPTESIISDYEVTFNVEQWELLSYVNSAIQNVNGEWLLFDLRWNDTVSVYNAITGTKISDVLNTNAKYGFYFTKDKSYLYTRKVILDVANKQMYKTLLLSRLLETSFLNVSHSRNDSTFKFAIDNGNCRKMYTYNVVADRLLDSSICFPGSNQIYELSNDIFTTIPDSTSLVIYNAASKKMYSKSVKQSNVIVCNDKSTVLIETDTNDRTKYLQLCNFELNKEVAKLPIQNIFYGTVNSNQSLNNTMYSVSPDGMLLVLIRNDSLNLINTSTGEVESIIPLQFLLSPVTATPTISFIGNRIITVEQAALNETKKVVINLQTRTSKLYVGKFRFVTSGNQRWVLSTNASYFMERMLANTLDAVNTFPKLSEYQGEFYNITISNTTPPDNIIVTGSSSVQISGFNSTVTKKWNYNNLITLPRCNRVIQLVKSVNNTPLYYILRDGKSFDSLAVIPVTNATKLAGFSPDGKYILMIDSALKVNIYSSDIIQLDYTINVDKQTTTAALSRDNKNLVTSSNNGIVSVWDVASGSKKFTLTTAPTSYPVLGFTPTGKYILTQTGLIDITDKSFIQFPLTQNILSATSYVFTNSDSMMYAGFRNSLLTYNIALGEYRYDSIPGKVFVHSIKPLYVVTGENLTNTTSVYELGTNKRLRSAENIRYGISLAWSEDASLIASIDSSSKLTLWKLNDGVTSVQNDLDKQQYITQLLCTNDILQIPITNNTQRIRIYSVDGKEVFGREVQNNSTAEYMINVGFLSTGLYFVSVQGTDNVQRFVFPKLH